MMRYYPDNDWHTMPPEQAGIPSLAIHNLLARIDAENMNLHGLVLLHNGYIICEKYWDPRYKGDAEYVYSITKAVVSLLVGIAIADGLLDIESTVISYFPDVKVKNTDENMKKLRIKHLLTMSSGRESDTEWDTVNAISDFFNKPIPYEPGTRFHYLGGCATMLSAIIQKLTGKSLVDYADEKLFSLIGIEKPRWDANPDGICYGGVGIWLKTRDIARLGLLLLSQGKWKDTQIIPQDYIMQATNCMWPCFTGGDPNQTSGYGYLFWKNAPALGGYRITGNRGRHCIVLPDHNIACATTADGDMYLFLHALAEEVVSRIPEKS